MDTATREPKLVNNKINCYELIFIDNLSDSGNVCLGLWCGSTPRSWVILKWLPLILERRYPPCYCAIWRAIPTYNLAQIGLNLPFILTEFQPHENIESPVGSEWWDHFQAERKRWVCSASWYCSQRALNSSHPAYIFSQDMALHPGIGTATFERRLVIWETSCQNFLNAPRTCDCVRVYMCDCVRV